MPLPSPQPPLPVNQEHNGWWEHAGSAHILSLVSTALWDTIAFGSSSKSQQSFEVFYFDICSNTFATWDNYPPLFGEACNGWTTLDLQKSLEGYSHYCSN